MNHLMILRMKLTQSWNYIASPDYLHICQLSICQTWSYFQLPWSMKDRKRRWGKDKSRAVILLNHLANNFTKWMFQQLTILMLLLFFFVSLKLDSHPGVQGNLVLCYSAPNCSFRPISVWIKLRDLTKSTFFFFQRSCLHRRLLCF